MKIHCACGNTISHSTDGQPSTLHLLSDQQLHALLDSVDISIEQVATNSLEAEAASMKIRSSVQSQLVYRCEQCQRLYIQNEAGEYKAFTEDLH